MSRAPAAAWTLAIAAMSTVVFAQEPAKRLQSVVVTARKAAPRTSGVSPEIRRFQPPGTVVSIDQRQIEETTNTVDAEDAISYFPSLFVRKRGFGDTQPTIETRTWGINSSARSLVYVDDVPISALISNNNTTGAPRWGMVSPEVIAGIDMLYGPFAAEYPGNSMGGVLLITTRMPTHFEASVGQAEALQTFDWYRTHHSYRTSNTTATIGDKEGPFSWFLSANREDTFDQPLYFVTSGSIPAGTSGAIPSRNKTGAKANVVGAGGIQHAIIDNVTGKFAFDLTDWLRATYSVGYFDDQARAADQSYLTTSTGAATFGSVSGFANDEYAWRQRHLMNALSFETHTNGTWDLEAIATRYDYLEDIQRTPAGVLGGQSFKTNGYIARMDGTGWSTEDLKGIWRPTGIDGEHEVSFGVHRDQYILDNPTYDTGNWTSSPDIGDGILHTEGRGRTVTDALWAQDVWRFAPSLKLTTGGRLESWRADEGLNLAGDVAAAQPVERSTNFSPKASLVWQVDPAWSARLSFGIAYRYPTVGELYQIVSTGGTYSIPNPDLTPEHDSSEELAIERAVAGLRVRMSLFQENTRNALISQTNLLADAYTTTFQNVGEIRNRGVELAAEWDDAFIRGLDLSDSVTYVDSTLLSDPTFESAAGTTATGKQVPYVPEWRNTAQATYRASARLALSIAARYQGRMYSTLDNTDSVSHVFGAFDDFFVVDAHVHYRISRFLSADGGVDNLFNDRYFEYHPFPTRTFVVNLKARF